MNKNKKIISDKLKVVLTLAICFISALMIFLGLEYYQFTKEVKFHSQENLEMTRQSYLQNLKAEINKVCALLKVLDLNTEVKEKFKEKDRYGLYNLCFPIFDDLKNENNISNWYFIEPDSTYFLRMNNYAIYGDKAGGYLYKQAVDNHDHATGIEFTDNDFSIRVIHKYYDKDSLIGYTEIGEEIGQIFKALKQETGNDVSLFINKKYIERADWEFLKLKKGLKANWEHMENYADIEQTIDIDFTREINIEELGDEGTILETVKENGSYYSKSVFPVYDTEGKKIGGVFVLTNVDSIYKTFISRLISTILIYLSSFIVIGVIIFLIIQRINKDIRMAKLDAEKSAHKALVADSAKSEFLANMSHEIRTPMNAIMGFSEILKEQLSEPKYLEYIDIIITSGKTLLGLINDILDLSKIEAGKMEFQYRPVDPHALFGDIAKIFAGKIKNKGLRLITEIDGKLPASLLLDEVRIRQILFNLVGNAVKFTAEGYIELKVKGVFHPDRSKIDLIFSVKDTGIGISQDDKKVIFDAFTQSKGQSTKKYGGTGLGLAITKKLVELMNGEISVDSIVGKGSIFKVIIKEVFVASVDHDIDEKKLLIEDISFHNQKILVVDDIQSNRLLLNEILSIYGLHVLEAANGKEAINIARSNNPDIILMDLRMPVMDGYEAIKILKSDSKLKSIPVIVLTASAMKTSEEDIKKINSDGYLRKPISRPELLAELKKYLKYEIIPKDEITSGAAQQVEAVIKGKTGIKKLPELINRLENEISIKYVKLKKEFIINDIEDFAEEIGELGGKYGASILSDWGKKLSVQSSSFDLENLTATFDEFENILNKIKIFKGNDKNGKK